jgi:hypothetical protein
VDVGIGCVYIERMAAETKTAPVLTRKPVVRPIAREGREPEYDVRFPWGGRARIYPVSRADESIGWRAQLVDDAGETVKYVSMHAHDGNAATPELAFEAAGCEAFDNSSVPTWGTAEDVHKLARECDDDRTLFTKTIKRIAKERFGVKVNAKGSRGTAWGWVHVEATDETIGGKIVCGLVDGSKYSRGRASVRPCGGERVWVICQLAGHPLPEGFKVNAPEWD